jgi:hypothetical protein
MPRRQNLRSRGQRPSLVDALAALASLPDDETKLHATFLFLSLYHCDVTWTDVARLEETVKLGNSSADSWTGMYRELLSCLCDEVRVPRGAVPSAERAAGRLIGGACAESHLRHDRDH